MAIFVGDSKNSSAADCALKIHHVVEKIVRPVAVARLSSLTKYGYRLSHCVGVASGKALVVRGGVRGTNDLVSIGRAPNVAAKLSEVRNGQYRSFVTAEVFSRMRFSTKHGGNPQQPMWTRETRNVGGQVLEIYKSTWMRRP